MRNFLRKATNVREKKQKYFLFYKNIKCKVKMDGERQTRFILVYLHPLIKAREIFFINFLRLGFHIHFFFFIAF